MNAKELIKHLEKLPEDTEIVIHKWDPKKGSSFITAGIGASQKLKGSFILTKQGY